MNAVVTSGIGLFPALDSHSRRKLLRPRRMIP
ncbi:MAG: hypothetical protein KatS3mg022_2082 [Armatimonadota bacterium]|nr:MAG: hypothetical protein KatS3mg022_2082 [Armatimonadota bacterium]